MKFKNVRDPKHEEFRQELLAVVKAKGETMAADEVLAMVSYLVGQLLALQDQRHYTVEIAMQLVMRNIEAGNVDAIANLFATGAGETKN